MKLIVITVVNGKVYCVHEQDDEETKDLLPYEIYFGRRLQEGEEYCVFYHTDPEDTPAKKVGSGQGKVKKQS